jgi:DNA-binding XRE family transcriptional regulator
MNLNDLIASNIKDIRLENGFSCEYVANQLGITKGAYSNMENGKVEITIARLENVATILNVPMEKLIPLKKAITQISNGSGYNVSQEGPCNIINQHNFPMDEIAKIKDAISNIENAIHKKG